ncbi:winged helix-turn-helix domain-containing protein [Micromonospora sp. NPDC050795]|uniref:winged helix-turn-helix domain-containing protein n=1 Tax=Micromonospora sp. NPDC050795 TaxID=3364282 RepID=UPI003790524C
MSTAARARREAVRGQAAGMFEESRSTAQIASELRVSEKSVREWRRRWAAGGPAALASAGPGGPVAQGWADARRTLARVAEVIERRFGVGYTLRGVSYLLHRMGYSLQVPARRAVERDPEAIEGWQRRRWLPVASAVTTNVHGVG